MARFLRLRVRPGTGLFSFGRATSRSFSDGDEVLVRFEDAAALLRDKGRRNFDVIDDFGDESGLLEPDAELLDRLD